MTIDIAMADHETFQPHVGSTFTATAGDLTIALTLDNIRLLSEATRRDNRLEIDGVVYPPRRAFSLTFEGPREPLLRPQLCDISHPDCGTMRAWLSPFRQDQDCTLYEVSFS